MSFISTAGFVKIAVISCMWCVIGLCVLLVSVSCDESCPTWLHPSGGGKCVCLPLNTWVVCENETQVGVFDFYCLTSNGDGSNTSVVGRCLAALKHGERLLSPVGSMCSHVYHTVVLSDCTQCKYEHYIEKVGNNCCMMEMMLLSVIQYSGHVVISHGVWKHSPMMAPDPIGAFIFPHFPLSVFIAQVWKGSEAKTSCCCCCCCC